MSEDIIKIVLEKLSRTFSQDGYREDEEDVLKTRLCRTTVLSMKGRISPSLPWNMTHHVTSRPKYRQYNGLAEKTVHIAKRIFDKSKAYGKDRNLRFLEYRTIGYSPAHLLMSHKLRSTLLVILDELKPKRPVRVKEMIGSRKKVL